MANYSQRDINLIFVGGTATKTTGNPSTLNDGEIGIFAPDGTRLTEATAATATQFVIYLGRGTGNDPLVSNIIKVADLKRMNRRAYVAPTEKVDYIGFNGTSGAIEEINDNIYRVTLNLAQYLTSNHGGLYIKHGTYQSDSSATQAEVAAGVTQNLVSAFNREPERQIMFERVHSDAGAANTITAGTDATHYKFTYGSKFVVGTDGSGTAMLGADEINATVVAGDYIRVGTAVTSPVYKIVAVTSGTATTPMSLELDIKFQGTTTEVAIGSTEYITAALIAAGDFGIKLTGLPLTWVNKKIQFRMSDWKTTITDFGTTTVTENTKATYGSGAYKMVAEMEASLRLNEGDFYLAGEPNVFTHSLDAEVNVNYDLIDIEVVSVDQRPLIHTSAPKTYTLAIPETAPNYAVTGTADDITDVLEVLMFGSANGNLAVS